MALAKGLLDLGRAAIDLGDDAYRNLLRLIEVGYPDTTAMKIVTGYGFSDLTLEQQETIHMDEVNREEYSFRTC